MPYPDGIGVHRSPNEFEFRIDYRIDDDDIRRTTMADSYSDRRKLIEDQIKILKESAISAIKKIVNQLCKDYPFLSFKTNISFEDYINEDFEGKYLESYSQGTICILAWHLI